MNLSFKQTVIEIMLFIIQIFHMELTKSYRFSAFLAKIKSVVSVLISLISDTTLIEGQDIKPIFVGRRSV